MHNDLTNLLPQERERTVSRDYFLRLGVVAAVGVIVLTLVAMALLASTYIFLAASSGAKEAQLATIESALSAANESALSARLTALSANTAILSTLARMPSASATIRAVLAIARAGVTLSNFVYTAGIAPRPGTLAISGVALTRAALRSYQLALQSAPFARSVDLPVSAYAKDINIAFTITITLAP